MDEGFLAEARAITMKQEREEVYVALQYAASFHCLVEEWKACQELVPIPKEERSEGMKHLKMPGRCTGPKLLSQSSGKWRRRHLGGHDLVRRMDRQGEVSIWCSKCSGYARQRMGPKLVTCCRPEQMGTKEFGKMMKNPTLEEGRVPAKEVKNWRIEGEKKRIASKEFQRLLNNFEMEGLTAQKGLWNLAKEKLMNERGELPSEEGDVVREFKAMHEEDFWSSWPREESER